MNHYSFLFWAALVVIAAISLSMALKDRRELMALREVFEKFATPPGIYNVDSICTKCNRICPYCYPETKSLPDTPVERSQPSAWSP